MYFVQISDAYYMEFGFLIRKGNHNIIERNLTCGKIERINLRNI